MDFKCNLQNAPANLMPSTLMLTSAYKIIDIDIEEWATNFAMALELATTECFYPTFKNEQDAKNTYLKNQVDMWEEDARENDNNNTQIIFTFNMPEQLTKNERNAYLTQLRDCMFKHLSNFNINSEIEMEIFDSVISHPYGLEHFVDDDEPMQ